MKTGVHLKRKKIVCVLVDGSVYVTHVPLNNSHTYIIKNNIETSEAISGADTNENLQEKVGLSVLEKDPQHHSAWQTMQKRTDALGHLMRFRGRFGKVKQTKVFEHLSVSAKEAGQEEIKKIRLLLKPAKFDENINKNLFIL